MEYSLRYAMNYKIYDPDEKIADFSHCSWKFGLVDVCWLFCCNIAVEGIGNDALVALCLECLVRHSYPAQTFVRVRFPWPVLMERCGRLVQRVPLCLCAALP
ncbi:hypothetical protein chiPu_0010019 [Chiloscyllium punctatum]|uniref:Uncharacterized protein n=1 Tax=Chiloscyllium punctatum TaxID=137246 RepID=A0A401SMF1_CHIPU|nr:hypothetical protein [Chiloscyllium punctatum]